jgi:hypothetical protein
MREYCQTVLYAWSYVRFVLHQEQRSGPAAHAPMGIYHNKIKSPKGTNRRSFLARRANGCVSDVACDTMATCVDI